MIRGQSYKNIIAFAIDCIASICAAFIGLYLRLGVKIFYYSNTFLFDHIILFIFSIIISQLFFKIYKDVWRFFNLDSLFKIAKFATLTVLIFLLMQFFDSRLEQFPRSVIIIDWLLIIFFVAIPRILYRAYFENTFKYTFKKIKFSEPNLMLIIGLDKSIEKFIQEMSSIKEPSYKIIGIIGDKQNNVGRILLNVPILGIFEDLKDVIDKLTIKNQKPARILVSSDFKLTKKLQQLIELCDDLAIPLSRLPKITFLSHNVNFVLPLNPIPLEDLLHRSQKNLNFKQIHELTHAKTILITGAGGSIGSEIVRQVCESKPKRILLLDYSEFLLYEIEQECRIKFPQIKFETLLIDIRDKLSLNGVFNKFKPNIILHAAALKHVPLLEQHKVSAVETNIFGTIHLVDLALEFKCANFVMISTDKAVNPLSFMGASKRVAEMYCQTQNSKITKINIVRFGNVLGSNGSVVPLFEKQIAFGGPITLTSPEATRFFMTIKEAVGLVLQAAALKSVKGKSCNVYVLDMGEPVKIVDLARKMIILAGLKPDQDIKIKFIGLRPGEKLHETLITEHESLIETSNKDIFHANPKVASKVQLIKLINQLHQACNEKNEKLCNDIVMTFVKV